MKKTLIALAAVAATGASFAQSTVTIDGQVDLGVVKPIGTTGTRLDAANGSTQIRFRGSEDLGGGLRANFVLAQRLSLESGNNDGTANGRPTFQGESTIGLSGGFGAVRLGRALSALQGPVNLTDPWGTLQQASTALLTNGYATDPRQGDGAGLGRTDAIHYSSPNFGGFTGAISYGFKNSTASTPVLNTDAFTSVWLSYAAGPIYIGGGAESNRRNDDMMAILGTYDFGAFKLGAGYGSVELAAGNEHSNWNIMGIVPLGAMTVKVGYGVSKQDKGAGGVNVEADLVKKLGIGIDYPLSKRTLVYVSYGRDSVRTANKTGYDVGLRHTF
ncbi:porin [Hydrogenophaga sp. XSHU_21]